MVVVAALLAGFAGYWIGDRQHREAATPDNADTQRFLSMPVQDLNGKPVPLSLGRGKLRVVNLWATWCPPCRAEMPAFSRISSKYTDKGVEFIGVAVDDPARVRDFLRETPVSYPIVTASPDVVALSAPLGNQAGGLPFSIIVDANGQHLAHKLGQWKEADLEAELNRLLPTK